MPGEAPAELIVAEPPGHYTARPPLVADSSVLAALLFEESERDRAATALAGHELYAPDLLDHELANVAVKKSPHIRRDQQWRLALRFDLRRMTPLISRWPQSSMRRSSPSIGGWARPRG